MSFFLTLIIIAVIFFKAYKKSNAQKEAFKKQQGQKTYSSPPPSSNTYRKAAVSPKEDILTRSKKNVAGDFGNTSSKTNTKQTKEQLLRKQQDAIKAYNASSVPTPSPSFEASPAVSNKTTENSDSDDLMKTVQDLIVKGYEPKMTFERDFISEGMDLLNSYYH